MTRTSTSRGRRAAWAALLAGVLVGLGGLDTVSAFWTASSTVPGSGAARLVTVLQASTPVVTVTSNDVVIDWDPSTLSNGTAVTGYTVQRYSTTDVLQTTLAGCAGTLTATVCTETNVPNGLWTYAVTPRFATNWAGPQSARSAQVRSDGTAPTNTITRNVVTGNSFRTGSLVYYRGAAAGSFTLTSTVVDTNGSGPASAATGALGGTTTGWSHTPSTVTTPTGGPYVSNPFSWTAGTTSAPTVVVTARDVNDNALNTTLTLTNDSTAPTGGSLSHLTGAQTLTTLPITLGAVTESQSGLASRQLQQRSAPLSGSTCGTFTAYATVSTSGTSPNNRGVTAGNCYEFQNVLTDNVGNVTTVPGPGVARIRNYGAVVSATAGRLSHWRLNGSAATAAVVSSGTANPVTWTGSPTFSSVGAIAGDSDTSVTFDGVDDFGAVNRGVSTNFSIEFWFRSTSGIGAGTNWYDGAGLVDGDVAGSVNDFGISLSSTGQVTAGTGNPDTTIRSGTGFNEGSWHHVVLTRTQSTGTITLYVDGAQRATGTGSTAALTSPTQLNIGRLHNGGNYYAGALDELATYTTALSPATVLNHYQTGLP